MRSEIFYAAMLARDYRFDGKFFVGVKTTGIYCRPICPAKPKIENVEFYPSALAAERAGYRPCLRCRPESAPLSPAWHGKSAIVNRALKLIAQNGLLESDEEEFAARFGVTSRHLRRLFVCEIGQTPKQISDNNRLGFARKLIAETNLPFTTVATTSGFSSLRRFNDAFKKRFHRAPSAVRKKQALRNGSEGITLSLAYRPPFDWNTLLNFYRSHQIIGVEQIEEQSYSRVFKIGETSGFFRVQPHPKEQRLLLQVETENPGILFSVAARVRQMFDLDSDPLLVANSFRFHPTLDGLWKKYPGLRLARGWDPFEAAIGTILGQLVSISQARNLMAQLVQAYGTPFSHLSLKDFVLFPTAKILAKSDLAALKTTGKRKETIRELSRLVSNGKIDLVSPQDPAVLRKRLLEIPGIGPWSAEYISLRALGDTDAFPASDLILKRAIEKHSDIEFERIRPWRSYAAIYLWKEYAETLSAKKDKNNAIQP
jgi:AraC family transcriptional regulator of adaptative response / DNA-3-methyladenine glycosylase II